MLPRPYRVYGLDEQIFCSKLFNFDYDVLYEHKFIMIVLEIVAHKIMFPKIVIIQIMLSEG